MLAAIACGAGGFVIGRNSQERVPVAPAPTSSLAQIVEPVLPVVQPPLGRAELIAAASEAASAFSVGRPVPQSVLALVGRQFELRVPFGCPGIPQSPAAALGAQYDEEAEALRIRAEPVRWSPQEWWPAQQAGTDPALAPESIEGFWIARPWAMIEACPPTPPAVPGEQHQAIEPEQVLGIAQFFTSDGSRVGRRDGKAYEAVDSLKPDALDLSQGLRLRLRGKLARAPGAGPALCRGAPGTRPVCLLAVRFDQVAIENPATGESLATWDVSVRADGSKEGGR